MDKRGSGGEGAQASGARVLVVDDEQPVARMVARWLEGEGAEVRVVHSYGAAMEAADRFACDLVVSDIHMPDGSGLDLARWFKDRDSTVQVVLMTGSTDVGPAVQALRLHADDYLVKPFRMAELLHSARRAVEHRRLTLENHSYRRDLEERVREQAQRLERLYVSGIHSLVTALEAKDAHTRGHSDRVAEFAAALATEMGGLGPEVVRIGARLHDIGKIGIQSAVLRKPGRLTIDEADHIRAHPTIGEQILAPMLDDEVILGIVRHHHERWDGAGYPDGLRGAEIPLAARIVAVADAFDAITTTRPYRPAASWDEALAEIEAEAGRQFDPDVASAACRVFMSRVEMAS